VRHEYTASDGNSASALLVYAQNYWVFGLFPLSGILENKRTRFENSVFLVYSLEEDISKQVVT
jgi:hypothetical protein